MVVQVLLTPEQVEQIDKLATEGRSAYVRELLSAHLTRIVSGQEDHHVSTPAPTTLAPSDLEAVTATLDRLEVPPGPLLWRLGYLEASFKMQR